MPEQKVSEIDVVRYTDRSRLDLRDMVVIEEPLEIIAAWTSRGEPREKVISVTMRTPGDDFDLAVGFLFTERFFESGADIASIRHWSSPNRVRVELNSEARVDTSRINRNFLTTSSCGVCGTSSMDRSADRLHTCP
jgi:FdhD protein